MARAPPPGPSAPCTCATKSLAPLPLEAHWQKQGHSGRRGAPSACSARRPLAASSSENARHGHGDKDKIPGPGGTSRRIPGRLLSCSPPAGPGDGATTTTRLIRSSSDHGPPGGAHRSLAGCCRLQLPREREHVSARQLPRPRCAPIICPAATCCTRRRAAPTWHRPRSRPTPE